MWLCVAWNALLIRSRFPSAGIARKWCRSLHTEHSHIGLALQEAFGVVPEIDPADAALPDAAQVDGAAFAALPAL
jgi:hypothetical protein